MPDFTFENLHGRETGKIICGIDEVGRGPLAGPVMAAAAIIPMGDMPDDLATLINDSKKLSEKQREALYPVLTAHCLYAIGSATVEEIDKINILQATMLAMQRAVSLLILKTDLKIDHALIDGNRSPKLENIPTTPVVKGDAKSLSIAVASIIAKVTRDRFMKDLATQYPTFGWEHNAGYGTAIHMKALDESGPTAWHRQSFAPVAASALKKRA